MGAKDTVMKPQELADVLCKALGKKQTKTVELMLLEAQAEISFKAGQDQQIASLLAYAQSGELDKRFQELKQVGRKEVVEWIDKMKGEEDYTDNEYQQRTSILLDKVSWRQQLKEWGIKGD